MALKGHLIVSKNNERQYLITEVGGVLSKLLSHREESVPKYAALRFDAIRSQVVSHETQSR